MATCSRLTYHTGSLSSVKASMRPRNSLHIRPPKPAQPPVSRWEWLNKPIVLWVLSSLVLGLGSFVYGSWQANRQADLASN